MSDIPRLLITTADERTWRFDEPVLFLGEWCRRYDRNAVWERIPDARVAEPYGMSNTQKDEDFATVCRIVDEMLPIITRELNNLHGTNFSNRYWMVLLSIWLHRCVCVILNRYKTLEWALANYRISRMAVFGAPSYQLATSDSITFPWATDNDVWNNILFAEVAKFIPGQKVVTEEVLYDGDNWFHFREATSARKNDLKKTILKKLYNLYETLAVKLVRRDDAFLISTYAGRKADIMLSLALAQIPVLWSRPALEPVCPNHALRTDLVLKLIDSKQKGLDACVRSLIFKLMPTCFLEGYTKLVNVVAEMPWPEKPKFIFTSNNFDTDEVFKAWAGAKAETGIPYYTGQHGCNYGTFRYPISERYLVQMSDKFITWGWRSIRSKVIPGFIWNDMPANRAKSLKRSDLLIIGRTVPSRIYTWDVFCEMQHNQDAQFHLVENLSTLPRSAVLIRTYGGAERWAWCDRARWTELNPGIKFDEYPEFVDSVRNTRLVVFTFDSTGFLQLLRANYPVIGTWPLPLDLLRDEAKPYYSELMKAGILFSNPLSAAKFINEEWGNIDRWWYGAVIQNARAAFCDYYAVAKRGKISSLLNLLDG
jgi:putative transferase (TIGR04331 family)